MWVGYYGAGLLPAADEEEAASNARVDSVRTCPGAGTVYLGLVVESTELVFVRSLYLET